jgi:hypothetical protein
VGSVVSDPAAAQKYKDWVNQHASDIAWSTLDDVRSLRVSLQKLEGKQEELERRRLRTTDPASKRRTERANDRLDAEWRRVQRRLDEYPDDVIQAVDEALGNADVAPFINR